MNIHEICTDEHDEYQSQNSLRHVGLPICVVRRKFSSAVILVFFLPLYPNHTFEHRYNVRGTHLQFIQYPRIFHHPTACQAIIKTNLHRALPNTAGSSDRRLTPDHIN